MNGRRGGEDREGEGEDREDREEGRRRGEGGSQSIQTQTEAAENLSKNQHGCHMFPSS